MPGAARWVNVFAVALAVLAVVIYLPFLVARRAVEVGGRSGGTARSSSTATS